MSHWALCSVSGPSSQPVSFIALTPFISLNAMPPSIVSRQCPAVASAMGGGGASEGRGARGLRGAGRRGTYTLDERRGAAHRGEHGRHGGGTSMCGTERSASCVSIASIASSSSTPKELAGEDNQEAREARQGGRGAAQVSTRGPRCTHLCPGERVVGDGRADGGAAVAVGHGAAQFAVGAEAARGAFGGVKVLLVRRTRSVKRGHSVKKSTSRIELTGLR